MKNMFDYINYIESPKKPDELHKDFILGNLHNQSLSEILISNKRLEFINNCKNCNYTKNIPCRTCINTGGRYTREKGDIKYE